LSQNSALFPKYFDNLNEMPVDIPRLLFTILLIVIWGTPISFAGLYPDIPNGFFSLASFIFPPNIIIGFFTIFARFRIRITGNDDPFYSAKNQAVLMESIAGLEAGKGTITKTMEELEAMENG
jgi:hypothetical protein